MKELLNHAIREIRSTYGEDVSVKGKAKSLLKFGRNEAVGTGWSTVMDLAGSELHETYVASNLITHVASADDGDNHEVVIEGHTISGGDFSFVVQTVTLDGQTKTALATPLARATRIYNNDSTDITGPIYVAQDVTFTGGVPQTDTAIHLILPSGFENQSRKCSTALSSTDYWIITNIYADVLEKTAAQADYALQIRNAGKVFRTVVELQASTNASGSINFRPYLIAPANSDVRLAASANSAGTDCSGGIQGFLAQVQADVDVFE